MKHIFPPGAWAGTAGHMWGRAPAVRYGLRGLGAFSEVNDLHPALFAQLLKGSCIVVHVPKLHEPGAEMGVDPQEVIHRKHRRLVLLPELDENFFRLVLVGLDVHLAHPSPHNLLGLLTCGRLGEKIGLRELAGLENRKSFLDLRLDEEIIEFELVAGPERRRVGLPEVLNEPRRLVQVFELCDLGLPFVADRILVHLVVCHVSSPSPLSDVGQLAIEAHQLRGDGERAAVGVSAPDSRGHVHQEVVDRVRLAQELARGLGIDLYPAVRLDPPEARAVFDGDGGVRLLSGAKDHFFNDGVDLVALHENQNDRVRLVDDLVLFVEELLGELRPGLLHDARVVGILVRRCVRVPSGWRACSSVRTSCSSAHRRRVTVARHGISSLT